MELSKRPACIAVGIVERSDGSVLICRHRETSIEQRRWEFPSTEMQVGEAPEAALRRGLQQSLGIQVDITVGQPPFDGERDGQQAVFRYFLCHVRVGQAEALAYEELRWVAPGQLCEYDFEPSTKRVVDWYAA